MICKILHIAHGWWASGKLFKLLLTAEIYTRSCPKAAQCFGYNFMQHVKYIQAEAEYNERNLLNKIILEY